MELAQIGDQIILDRIKIAVNLRVFGKCLPQWLDKRGEDELNRP